MSKSEQTDQYAFQNCRLGRSCEEITLERIEENRLAVQHMAAQARKTLRIISRDLDKAVYDDEKFVQIISVLARRSRFSNIWILIHDAGPAIKHGHRLIDLSQKLTSHIEIRKIHDDHTNFNEAFLLADGCGVIHRQHADRYNANVRYDAPLYAQRLHQAFMEIWEKSSIDPQLRRLYI